jgi:hypothetical protein
VPPIPAGLSIDVFGNSLDRPVLESRAGFHPFLGRLSIRVGRDHVVRPLAKIRARRRPLLGNVIEGLRLLVLNRKIEHSQTNAIVQQ